MNVERRRQMLIAVIEDLSAVLEQDGYMTVGSKGQPVAHPAMDARLKHWAELRQLEKVMGDEQDGSDDLEAFLTQVPDARRFEGRA